MPNYQYLVTARYTDMVTRETVNGAVEKSFEGDRETAEQASLKLANELDEHPEYDRVLVQRRTIGDWEGVPH